MIWFIAKCWVIAGLAGLALILICECAYEFKNRKWQKFNGGLCPKEPFSLYNYMVYPGMVTLILIVYAATWGPILLINFFVFAGGLISGRVPSLDD